MKTAYRSIGAAIALSIMTGVSVAGERMVFVPWKVLTPGVVAPTTSGLTLYWVPASGDEMRRSELIMSPALASYAGKCVAMHVIRTDDEERIAKLGVADELPLAILADSERQLARVYKRSGALRAFDVETMLRLELERREAAAESMFDAAKRHASAGDWSAAAAAYELVAGQKCAFPRLARSAQRALSTIRPAVARDEKRR
jgi:hypothetical protein